MQRNALTFSACPTWSPSDPATHAEGRDDQPHGTVLIGGHLH